MVVVKVPYVDRFKPWHWVAVALALLTIFSLTLLAMPHIWVGHPHRLGH
jgi:hypothetical protein